MNYDLGMIFLVSYLVSGAVSLLGLGYFHIFVDGNPLLFKELLLGVFLSFIPVVGSLLSLFIIWVVLTKYWPNVWDFEIYKGRK